MWFEKLIELKEKSGLTTKQIAEKKHLSEKTVARIFSGETDRPYMDTLCDIVSVLGGALDDLFSESNARLASGDIITMQNDVDRLNAENAMLRAENAVLKDKITVLTAESDILRVKLEHKDEIIALHSYYNSRLDGVSK